MERGAQRTVTRSVVPCNRIECQVLIAIKQEEQEVIPLKPVLLFLAVLVDIGCSKQATVPTDPRALKYGEPFVLKIGQTAMLPDGWVLRFDSVPNDSRCPRGCECFWQGFATVVLVFPYGMDTLNTLGKQITTQRADTIKLLSLWPYPEAGRPIPARAYVVTLVAVADWK